MTRRTKDELRSERVARVEAQLDRARSSLDRTAAEIGRRGAVPVAGDLLLAPGGVPELLVLAVDVERDRCWVVPLEDTPSESGIAFEDELSGTFTVAPRSASWVMRAKLIDMRRSGVAADSVLQEVKRVLTPVEAAIDSSLSSERRVERRPRLSGRTLLTAAAAAGVAALAVAGLLTWKRNAREHAGLYALRGAAEGEAGVELEIDGRVCLARGVLDGGVCRVAPEEQIDVAYRLDTGVEHRFAVVLFIPRGRKDREILHPNGDVSAALPPTASNGSERCARGFCALTRVDSAPGELWVVFLRDPVPLDRLPPDDPSSWPGAVPYQFTIEPR